MILYNLNENVKQKKILITKVFVGAFDGVFTYIFNLLRKIDLGQVQVDLYISIGRNSLPIGNSNVNPFLYELTNMGVNVYVSSVSQSRCSYLKDCRDLNILMKKNNYEIIYINTGSVIFEALNLYLAKMNNIPKRIAHSHGSTTSEFKRENIFKRFCYYVPRKIIRHNATSFIACSMIAGNSLYGKELMSEKGCIVRNGIDVSKFTFCESFRNKIRKTHKIEDSTFVVGLVANFIPVKNHLFLLKVFSEVIYTIPDSMLLLIGKGNEEQNIIATAKELGVYENIIFAGSVMNANEYYSAMDVFVMPSFHEGLPYVGVEAQASCLPCIFSDSITKELNITENCHFYPLTRTASEWAKKILEITKDISVEKRKKENSQIFKLIREAGFDVNNSNDLVLKILDI